MKLVQSEIWVQIVTLLTTKQAPGACFGGSAHQIQERAFNRKVLIAFDLNAGNYNIANGFAGDFALFQNLLPTLIRDVTMHFLVSFVMRAASECCCSLFLLKVIGCSAT